MGKWKTVALPSILTDKIEKALSVGGYQSKGEFVRDACRRLLELLEGSSGESPKTAEKEGPRAEEREILEAA